MALESGEESGKESGYNNAESPTSNLKREHWSAYKWRRVISLAALAMIIVFFINVTFAVVAIIKLKFSHGIGTLYTGDCVTAKNWSTALHLIINVLSSTLLLSSNFTMQCLSSPTRIDINKAHERRTSLAIGTPSVKNLPHISPQRMWLWLGLVLSSLPLHMLYNSSILVSLGSYRASYLLVDESFFNTDHDLYQEPLLYPGRDCSEYISAFISQSRAAYLDGNYSQRLTTSQCIDAYNNPYLTDRRNLIAITQPSKSTKMTPGCAFAPALQTQYRNVSDGYGSYVNTSFEGFYQPLWNGSSIIGISGATGSQDFTDRRSLDWMCYAYERDWEATCDSITAAARFQNNGSWYLKPESVNRSEIELHDPPQSYEIIGCISEIKVPQVCQLNYVAPILYIVIACNLVKVICMALTLRTFWIADQPIIATAGDAVLSFLQCKDETTNGWCLLDQKDLDQWQQSAKGKVAKPKCYTRRSRLVLSTTSLWKWLSSIIVCLVYLAIAVILLENGIHYAGFQKLTLEQLRSSSLGAVEPRTMLNWGSGTGAVISNTLFANTFQLALSISYFLYNALLTAHCGAFEWASYGIGERKLLRVSFPLGQQKSSYYLQLPYHYSIPLMFASLLMHFFISQSVFVVLIVYQDNGWPVYANNLTGRQQVTAVGFSFLGIVISLCIGSLLILVIVLHSFRKLETDIPLHGNHSVIISALCHSDQPEDDERNFNCSAGLTPIMWGATTQPDDIHHAGHCSLVEKKVEMPIEGAPYR